MSEQLRRIGYIRMSPIDHHPHVQAEAFTQAGCTELHTTNSGVDQRQALKELLDLLSDGDALVVYSMGQVAHDETSIENFQQQLKAAGVELVTAENTERIGENHA